MTHYLRQALTAQESRTGVVPYSVAAPPDGDAPHDDIQPRLSIRNFSANLLTDRRPVSRADF